MVVENTTSSSFPLDHVYAKKNDGSMPMGISSAISDTWLPSNPGSPRIQPEGPAYFAQMKAGTSQSAEQNQMVVSTAAEQNKETVLRDLDRQETSADNRTDTTKSETPADQKQPVNPAMREFELQELVRLTDFTYGSDSPASGSARAKLAQFYQSQGRKDAADVFYKEAIVRLEHSNLANDRTALAGVLEQYGTLKKANGQSKEAEDLQKRSKAVLHLNTAESVLAMSRDAKAQDWPSKLQDFASALHENGQDDRADKTYKMAIKIMEEQEGATSPKLLPLLKEYSQFLKDTNHIDFALADRIQSLQRNQTADNEQRKVETGTQVVQVVPAVSTEAALNAASNDKSSDPAAPANVTPENKDSQDPQKTQIESKDVPDKDKWQTYEEMGKQNSTELPESNESNSGTQLEAVNEGGTPSAEQRQPEAISRQQMLKNLELMELALGSDNPKLAEAFIRTGDEIAGGSPPDPRLAEQMYVRSLQILDVQPPGQPYLLMQGLKGYEKLLEAEGPSNKLEAIKEREKSVAPLAEGETSLSCSINERGSDFAQTMGVIAAEYTKAGNYPAAERLYAEALRSIDSREQSLDPARVMLMLGYANVLRATNRGAEAEAMEKQAKELIHGAG